MKVEIEVPDLANLLRPSAGAEDKSAIHRATVEALCFEEDDEIEEGALFAVLFNEHGSCEIVAPASGLIEEIRYREGDTVLSEEVLATIHTDS